MLTEVMFELDSVEGYVAHDVVREEKNLHEIEVPPREPSTVPERRRNAASGSRRFPLYWSKAVAMESQCTKL
jgi:hypothetical protein